MPKAMVAHEKALQWQELFELAIRENMSREDILSMGYRIAGISLLSLVEVRLTPWSEDLSSKKRYSEAARVLLDYSKDVRRAVIALVQGHNISEARRIVSETIRYKHSFCSWTRTFQISLFAVPDLVTDIIYPGALESRSQFGEDINEMKDQLRKQIHRLRELRVKKVEEPGECCNTCPVKLFNNRLLMQMCFTARRTSHYTPLT